MATKGIPSVPDVPTSLNMNDVYRILEPLARIISIRQGRFDPLDRWVTQQDLIDAGLQTEAAVEAPVVVVPSTSVYDFQLTGDINGGPTEMASGDPLIQMDTIINLPNVTEVFGGDAAETFPSQPQGPYGVVGGGGGGGDVTKVGTPADNQIAVWTGDGTIEGEADITYNQTTLTLANHTAMQLPSGYRIQFANANFHINGQASKIQVAGTNFETQFDATIGAGGVGTSQLNINANATGTTYLNFKQNGVIKGFLAYENTGAQMKLDSDGQIILSPNNTTAVTLATTGAATFAKTIIAPASTTSVSSLRLPHGSDPTSPTNGDMWTTTAGVYAQINGTKEQLNNAAGTWELISTTAITAVATIDLTWDETAYDEIKLVIEDCQTDTDADHFHVQFGHTDGATILTAANYSDVTNSGTSTWTSATGQTYMRLTRGGSMGNAAGEYFQGTIVVQNFASANAIASLEARTIYDNTIGNKIDSKILGRNFEAGNAIDTVRLSLNAGSFVASGTIRMYGLRNS